VAAAILGRAMAQWGRRPHLAVSFIGPALLLSGCGQSTYTWGWHVVSPFDPRGLKNLGFLADGLWSTISISLISIVISVQIGIVVALMALSKRRAVRSVNRAYVEVFRAIPLLVLLMWVYYGLPVVLGLQFGVFAAGVIALSLSDSAFEAEIFRGGIQSVERGQREAAQAVGLTSWQTMRLVILPQALRRILPALGNQFVYVLKMSSLISVVGLQDLTRRANELTLVEYRPLEIYTVLVIEYLLLILLASWMVRRLEQRLGSNQVEKR
jgi:His/Glu/Gln/Arg/opine family amino acid ABC transporter permease subunit